MLRRNVLIFHAGALGDFVLSWPLALALGRLYPQSRIIYVVQPQKGALAARALRIEATDAEAGWHHLYNSGESLPASCRNRLEGSHSIFTFVAGEQDQWTKTVRQIAPEADLVLLKTKPPDGYASHASQYLLESLESKPVVQTAVRQILASIAADGISVSKSPVVDVLIHPGSGSVEKCWPAECFLNLIQRLKDEGRSVRVVLGEVETERWPGKIISQFESAATVVRPGTYLDLLGQLQAARCFVGNDSGPGHLSGVIGVRTVALFGPTHPAVWKPLGPRVEVLYRNPLPTLAADEVYEVVARQLQSK